MAGRARGAGPAVAPGDAGARHDRGGPRLRLERAGACGPCAGGAGGGVDAGRAGGVIGSSRRAIARVLHELAPGAAAGVVAGAWPARGVVRRIAVTVTLARAGPVVSVGGDPVVGATR